MCNACGFRCCGSDQFTGCGCYHCDEFECRFDDDEIDDGYDEDDYDEDDYDFCPCRKPSAFQCVESA